MTRSVRPALIGSILIGIVAAGCQGTPVASPTPTIATSTATPTPTPSPTPSYGPNATAALTAVTAYYSWINKYSQDPTHPYFIDLNRVAKGEALSTGASTVNLLALDGSRQVGDFVIAQLVPDGESPTQIGVAVCLDSSTSIRVDKNGQTIPPTDGLTRRNYVAKVENQDGAWFVTSARGGSSSC